ncbi:MAG: CBS domain-containing protein [Planctomycetota bacterium]|jgi:CBS domain-containing protein
MQISSIMSGRPLTVTPHTSAADALRAMHERHVRHLPVVHEERLVGEVSERDLLLAVGWLADGAGAAAYEPDASHRTAHETTVAELMRSAPSTLTRGDTVVTACVLFQVEQIGCAPVLDDDGALVGIVTETDLLKAYWSACRDGRLEGDVDPPVSEHMTRDPVALQVDADLSDAVTLCRAVHGRHLPVLDEGRLAGIISDRDLRAAAGAGIGPERGVAQEMTRDVITVAPDAPLSRAAELMDDGRIGALPVVEDGQLVGILTLTDVVDHCINTLRDPD